MRHMENMRDIDSYIRDVIPESGDGGDDKALESGMVVKSCDEFQYIDDDKKREFVGELERISRDLIFIKAEFKNDDSETRKYNDFFKIIGYHTLFIDSSNIIVFKRKIPSWDSKLLDMEDYIRFVIDGNGWNIDSILDCGTGQKGIVGQSYYENEKKISFGYGCDVWTIKEMSGVWKPIKMNALDLLDELEPKSVDVVQAFGFLEHLTKEDGYKFLDIAEKLARFGVILSAATFVHGMSCDEKALKDGNPYHEYRSVWHWKEFEKLGYSSNFEDMRNGITFSEECIAWKML